MPSDDRAKGALSETTRVLGERVRERRQKLGISQESAAARIGINWSQLGKIERGQRSMMIETLLKIAAGLDIDAGELVSGLPVPPSDT